MFCKLSRLCINSHFQAAAHIHRYLALDENILLETTADSVKGRSKEGGSLAVLVTLSVLRLGLN